MVSYGPRKGSDFRITLKASDRHSSEPASAHAAADDLSTGLGQALVRGGRVRAPAPTCFLVNYRGCDWGEFRLHVPGVHNVLNATAAIAVGIGLDIPVPHIQEALENFRGVDRRFELCGQAAGVTVIDDYGHHPTEIRATLAAAQQCGYRKIHVIFQPHRYTRTRDLMDEFATAFANADSLIVLDIYPASEQPIEGITGEALTQRIREKASLQAEYAGSFEEGVAMATSNAHEGDMILTLGAGSVSQLGPLVLERLQQMLTTAQD
jgi:UDP-N-acetylmuramate--alanine ligase